MYISLHNIGLFLYYGSRKGSCCENTGAITSAAG